MAAPPPLPPRDTSQLPPPPPLPPRDISQLPPPPPYSAVDESQGSLNSGQENRLGGSILGSKVPRPSSSLSLAPSSSDLDGKRTLLLVYIHGFYGNDQSFQSFPRHVHNMIRETLSETHAVYSKVYPRYKTYKPIEVARDNFSAWLEPHESPTTDVILIGHSMGGLLAAEVILMSNWISSSRQPLRHRILGSLSLDSPFLGLHPGIVASGLSSLFHPSPAPTPPNQDAASLSSGDLGPSSPASFNNTPSGSRDPNFDPPYFNDSPFREQPFLTRMLHFGSKHWSEGIFTALAHHVAAHLEFGGCLADYSGLKSRYNQLRALEDIDEFQNLSATSYNIPRPRVRFLNYYTLSPGRPKQPAGAKGSQSTSQVDLSTESVPEIKIQDQINDKLVHAIISARLEDEEKNQADESLSNIKITVKDDDGLNKFKTAHLGPQEDEKIVDTNSMAEQEELEEKILDKNRLSTQSMQSMQSMQNIDPIPMDDDGLISVEQELESAVSDISDRPPSSSIENKADEKNDSSETDLVPPNLDLPPIPDLPNPPEQPDLSQYTDKDARKQAEREFSRRQKAHEQAAKDRAKAIREREKLIEKLQKKAQKEAQKDADKLEKDTKKQQQKSEQDKRKLEKEEEKAAKAEKKQLEKEEEKAAKAEKKRLEKEAAAAAKQRAMAAASSQAAASSTSSLAASSVASPYSETEAETPGGKRKKLGKFCTTPHKTNGVMDPTWVSVFMDGMDEVTAHCGLFFPGPHYDRLVGDVSDRIVSWVQHNLSVRTVLEMGPK